MPVSRFAPSPTGFLHLGHAYSALKAFEGAGGGRFYLRFEDIDEERCREEYVEAIYEDLEWLGLRWEGEVWFQSRRREVYGGYLEQLRDEGLLYPCFCTRKEIREEVARMGAAPHGPDGPVYPGTCRGLSAAEREDRMAGGEDFAWRLDMSAACDRVGEVSWKDGGDEVKSFDPGVFGDVVLARKDTGLSYFLCCTVDDHVQGIELVTRGRDLFESTAVQVLLQGLLGLATPVYEHHALVVDENGKRLAKRSDALAVRVLREGGMSAAEVVGLAERSVED